MSIVKRKKILNKEKTIAFIHQHFQAPEQFTSSSYKLICDGLVQILTRGMGVELEGVGRLLPVLAAPRVGRNPKAPKESIQIPAQLKVKFEVDPKLKKKMFELQQLLGQ